MTAAQQEFNFSAAPSRRTMAPAPGSAWVESWHNHDLTWGSLTKEQQVLQLQETAKWLFAGRRWPMDPSDRQISHAEVWFPRVAQIMRKHGWELEWREHDLYGYVVTWRLQKAPEHEISGIGCSAHYAAITAAAICRRKARYYGLWQNYPSSATRPDGGHGAQQAERKTQ